MTPAEFKTRYPAFVSVDDAYVQSILDEQLLFLDVDRWGELFSQAQGLLTAHELTISNNETTIAGGVADDKTSVKAGDVSYSKDAGMLARYAESPYTRTTYGQRYLYLRNQVGMGIVAI